MEHWCDSTIPAFIIPLVLLTLLKYSTLSSHRWSLPMNRLQSHVNAALFASKTSDKMTLKSSKLKEQNARAMDHLCLYAFSFKIDYDFGFTLLNFTAQERCLWFSLMLSSLSRTQLLIRGYITDRSGTLHLLFTLLFTIRGAVSMESRNCHG